MRAARAFNVGKWPLVFYLRELEATAKGKVKHTTGRLLHRVLNIRNFAIMVVYEAYATALCHFSLQVQGEAAVLPTLQHSRKWCIMALEALLTCLARFRRLFNLPKMQYGTLALSRTKEDYLHVCSWVDRLHTRAVELLNNRFPQSEPIMNAAAICDGGTWPGSLQFDKEHVQCQLHVLSQKFPQAELVVDAGLFISMAKRAMAEVPLRPNKQGHVWNTDCMHWVTMLLQWTASSMCSLQRMAALLLSIPVFWAHTETMNSILKKQVSTTRYHLNACIVAHEMAIRLLGPEVEDAEDIIHPALHTWPVGMQRPPEIGSDGDTSDSDVPRPVALQYHPKAHLVPHCASRQPQAAVHHWTHVLLDL